MKKQPKYWIIIRTILFLILGGCSYNSPGIPDFELGIPEQEINTRIRLEAPQEINSFKIGEIVRVGVEVVSDDVIVFQNDYNAKLLVLENNEWVEISNLMNYPEGHHLINPSNGDPFQIASTGFVPNLPSVDTPVTLRIIVLGKIYRDGQIFDEVTAAYIDVDLIP